MVPASTSSKEELGPLTLPASTYHFIQHSRRMPSPMGGTVSTIE